MVTIPLEPLILVDGSSFLFRAYYAMPPLSNKRGHPTAATYGVVNMLKKLQDTYKMSKIIVVFDTKSKNFRHDLFPEYKANRTEMPEELALQIPDVFAIIKAMGLPLITQDGVEADDIIGTLAVEAENNGLFTIIATSDKDMAQLVTEKIVLENTMTDTILDHDGVVAKFGVEPCKIIDYLSLIGDTVDNIPGVAKVGPKTAVKWLSEYGNLEGIIDNAEKIKGKVGENLRNSLADLDLYKKLVTIKLDVDLEKKLAAIEQTEPEINKLESLYENLEFKRWLQELYNKDVAAKVLSKDKYELILTQKSLSNIIEKIKKEKCCAIDTETTSLSPIDAKLVGVSLAFADNSCYIPVSHTDPNVKEQLDINFVLEKIKEILFDNSIIKIAHNLKYDLQILMKYGLSFKGVSYDTMLESYVYNSTASRHNMDALAATYLQYKTISYEDVVGKGVKQITFDKVELDKAYVYAAEDSAVTYALHKYFWPELKDVAQLRDVFLEIDMPLIAVLAAMETRGILIDSAKLEQQSKSLAKELANLESAAFTISQENFNLNSPKQLQEILFDKLNLPVLQKTPTGQPSTAEAALQELALEYELPAIVLKYRSLSKLKSTYTDSLPLQVKEETGRVHTSYHQAVTATGRLSSSDPNLQNIPIKTEEGRKIRQAFVAKQGYTLLSADYSQIELRLMAHLSQDDTLINAFAKGADIHKITAAEVFGVAVDKVTLEQRRHAKAINFGLMYGMSGFGLAKQLGTSVADADKYIKSYFERFPKVLDFIESTQKTAEKKGFVETIYGRRLYLPDIRSKNHFKKKAAQRAAINAPMQGGQADIIKIAMIRLHNFLQQKHPDVFLLLQVHDELVLEVPIAKVEEIKKAVIDIMSKVIKLKVSLDVSVGVGANWDEAH